MNLETCGPSGVGIAFCCPTSLRLIAILRLSHLPYLFFEGRILQRPSGSTHSTLTACDSVLAEVHNFLDPEGDDEDPLLSWSLQTNLKDDLDIEEFVSMRVPGTLPPCFPTTATRGLQGFARGWRHVLHCGPKLLETEFAPSVAEAGDSLHASDDSPRRDGLPTRPPGRSPFVGSTFVTAAALSQPSACPASVEENTTLADGLRVQSPTVLPSRTTCSWAPRLLQPVASCCWSTGIFYYCWYLAQILGCGVNLETHAGLRRRLCSEHDVPHIV